MKIVVIDVGGANLKLRESGRKTTLKIHSAPIMTARRMVSLVLEAVVECKHDVVEIGYPGAVRQGKPLSDPPNLGAGWVGFNFSRAFGKPVKVLNDAAMQAIGSYRGGRMLFLGLGTGLGSALIIDDAVEAMELAHL